jgi:AraC family transcriptional regulator, transcriptional activator of pobA
MEKDIPHIEFDPSTKENIGFEIVPVERIAQNRKHYEVNPEKPHQLKFYNLIFFTDGESKHFIDFKWYPIHKNSLIYLTKD